MKKYKVIMSTSYGHEIYFDAKNEDDAIEQAKNMSQEEIEKQTLNKWDVETFPMVVEVEEDK
jgi:uncharacterized protein (UPF0212 family)|tara:strand:- start:35 stop:220 length:186 start_codon:yes stop_codon:yes gene_type:complete